jgi:hypothetical protein
MSTMTSRLKDITYTGRPGMDRGWSAIICDEHGTRATATYVFQLEEMECVRCIAQLDADRQAYEQRADMLAGLGHPSICLCHTCAPWEQEYDRMQAEEAERLVLARLESPDYCDHMPGGLGGLCSMSGCRHAACKQDQEPPF